MIGPILSSGGSSAVPAGTTALSFPTEILIGVGAVRELPRALGSFQVSRPMIATDAGLVAAGAVAVVRDVLGDAVVFAEVPADPCDADVARGAGRYRENGCDGLIGLGGGTAITAAQAIRRTVGAPPLIAVPTTAGSGAEVAPTAWIRSPETGCKREYGEGPLLPSLTLCDPSLALTAPPDLTAATGLDALAHCLESYLASGFQPVCDGAAVEGLRYIFRGLETAVQDGRNVEARSAMTVGSMLGGTAAHKGLGVAHALAFAVEVDAPGKHATLVAILLAHALRFNREVAEPRMAELASRVGLGRAGDGPGHLITLVELLRANTPLPRKLGDVPGLNADRIPEYARLALLAPGARTNPRPCTRPLLEELLARAW